MNAQSPRPRILVRVSRRAAVFEVEGRLYLRVDAEGRWAMFGEGGATFRRTVDGRVLRPTGRGHESLTDAEAALVHGWVGRRAGELLEAVDSASPADIATLGDADTARERLAATSCWTRSRLMEERARFDAAYPEPIPILPPHRYRDLVVLPATGCPNHRCSFCAFYRDRPFHVLDDRAFDAHLRAVRDLFGGALAERDGIFLGSASALSLPDDVLRDRLQAIRATLGVPRRGIASFHDPDRGRLRSASAWRTLHALGLVEATLGLETGHRELRRRLGKSGDLDRFARTVGAQKESGLQVSLTVLLGLGGDERRAVHRAHTLEFMAGLPLDASDRIYLSPLAGTLGDREMASEIAHWREALRQSTEARPGEYRIDRFAWFA